MFEDLLDEGLVFFLPVNLALAHEDRHELFHGFVLVLEVCLDAVILSSDSGIIDLFSEFSKDINMLLRDILKLLLSFLWTGLLQDQGIDLLVFILGETLEGQVCVLSEDVCSQVEVVLLAVEQ